MNSEIARRVELILAAPLPTRGAVEQLCAEARREEYRSVVVPSSAVMLAAHLLVDDDIKVSCRLAYPDGSSDPDVKRYEVELAIDAGAHEIEVVPNLAKIEEGEFTAVLRELRDITEAADEHPVKVMVRAELWTPQVLREVAKVVLDSGALYIATGDAANGVGPEEIRALRGLTGLKFGVIASGVEDLDEAEELIAAGATLIVLNKGQGQLSTPRETF